MQRNHNFSHPIPTHFPFPTGHAKRRKHRSGSSKRPLLNGNRLSQVTREIDVQTLSNRKPVGHELQGNDVEKTLQTVDRLGDLDCLGLAGFEFVVVGVANYNWLS